MRVISGGVGHVAGLRGNRHAHSRACRREEGKQLAPIFGAGCLPIPPQRRIRACVQTKALQVHEQESEIVEHVCGRQAFVEFERVERCRRAVQHADIPQMQIAMPEAHAPLLAAPFNVRPDFAQLCMQRMR